MKSIALTFREKLAALRARAEAAEERHTIAEWRELARRGQFTRAREESAQVKTGFARFTEPLSQQDQKRAAKMARIFQKRTENR